jgi:hypothetical protein
LLDTGNNILILSIGHWKVLGKPKCHKMKCNQNNSKMRNENEEQLIVDAPVNKDLVSIIGRPINLNNSEYLQLSEGNYSIFDSVETGDYGILNVDNTEYEIPKELLGKGAKYMQTSQGIENSTKIDSGSSFYSYGQQLETSTALSTKIMSFSTQIDVDFDLNSSEWSEFCYALEKRKISVFQAKIDIISYLEDKYTNETIWNNELFKALRDTDPTKFINSQGTHIVAGFELGARYIMTFSSENTSKSIETTLKAAISAQNSGFFGIGGSSFNAKVFAASVEKECGFKSSFSQFERGSMIIPKDKDGGSAVISGSPAVISYYGKFIVLHELIALFDPTLAATYQTAYNTYLQGYQQSGPMKTFITINGYDNGGYNFPLGTSNVQDSITLNSIELDQNYLAALTDVDGNTITISGENVIDPNGENATIQNICLDIFDPVTKKVIQFGELKTVNITELTDDNRVATLFREKNFDYTNYWLSVNDDFTTTYLKEISNLNNHLYSMIVPENFEIRTYKDSKYESSMYGNIKGPAQIPAVWHGSDISSLFCAKQEMPLATFFLYNDMNYHNSFISLPVGIYRNLKSEYMSKILMDSGFFKRPNDMIKYEGKVLYNSINSVVIPEGITVVGYMDPQTNDDPNTWTGENQTIVGPSKTNVTKVNTWSALVIKES